jgi:hypothetical protein
MPSIPGNKSADKTANARLAHFGRKGPRALKEHAAQRS